jgi:hypothetical protein
MPKNNSDGGYRLPDVIDPEERICVTVRVPNDLMHLIAFWGALEELARWWNWERDAAKRGREAAAVWRAVIDEARANTVYGECSGGNVQVRQRPGEPCKLDVDYGSGWQQFADLRLCAPEVTVQPDGGINIGGTTVYPNAPLGVDPETNMPRQPQPRPQPASVSRPVCRAAANLIDVLILTHSELCARIDRPDAEKALAAIAVFAAVLVYPPNLIWALPLVAAFATINSICDEITDTTRTDAICAILSTGSVDASGRVTFDRDALIDALNPTGRPDIARIGFIAGYLDETSLNYAASVDMGGAADCPCEEVGTCVYQQPNWQNHAQILFGYGTWVSNGVRGVRFSFNPANYRAVVVRINHGSADARWKRVVIDTTMPPGTRGALRVSQSDVYTTWENLTEFVGPFGASFQFVYATSSPASPKTEILLETLTGDFVARRVTFYEAANMVNAECSVI